jgi:hypothetical protein
MAVTEDRWCPKCKKGSNDSVQSVQGDGWFGRTIRVPVPEFMQPTRLTLPDEWQELLSSVIMQASQNPRRSQNENG